jgi:hypothetical protein
VPRVLAVYAAGFVLLFSALAAFQPTYEILVVQLGAAISLLACLVVELRLHEPPLPVAIARVRA